MKKSLCIAMTTAVGVVAFSGVANARISLNGLTWNGLSWNGLTVQGTELQDIKIEGGQLVAVEKGVVK